MPLMSFNVCQSFDVFDVFTCFQCNHERFWSIHLSTYEHNFTWQFWTTILSVVSVTVTAADGNTSLITTHLGWCQLKIICRFFFFKEGYQEQFTLRFCSMLDAVNKVKMRKLLQELTTFCSHSVVSLSTKVFFMWLLSLTFILKNLFSYKAVHHKDSQTNPSCRSALTINQPTPSIKQ